MLRLFYLWLNSENDGNNKKKQDMKAVINCMMMMAFIEMMAF